MPERPQAPPEGGVLQLDPNQVLANPRQPRKRFSLAEMEELKASVSQDGVLQPILVRDRGGQHELVAGERRLRAARELGLSRVPALLIDVNDDRMLEIALIENIHREDLNPIELGQAFRELLKLRGWTQEELASNLKLGRSAVANTLRLLDLPEDIQVALTRGQITMGHAKVLLSVGDAREQRLLFEKIAEEKLSVRDLELARSSGNGGSERKGSRRRNAGKSPHLVSLEEEMGRALGTRVRIRQGKGKGLISIEFYSNDDFDRLRKLLMADNHPA